MKAWLHDLLDALLLRGASLARVAERPDAFFRGLTVIVAVALLVGLPSLVQDVLHGFQPLGAPEPAQVAPDLNRSLDLIRPWLRNTGVPEAVVDQILQIAQGNMSIVGTVATQIQQLPTALPRPLAQGFIALGHWLSLPFAASPFPLAIATLATWLGYGIWVMLAAKLLGGKGTLHGFFGTTAYFAVPHVLDIFRTIPVAGTILAVIAFFWGLVIYAVATGTSHRLSSARALVAVFAPLIVVLVLVALVLLALIAVGLIASVGGGVR